MLKKRNIDINVEINNDPNSMDSDDDYENNYETLNIVHENKNNVINYYYISLINNLEYKELFYTTDLVNEWSKHH